MVRIFVEIVDRDAEHAQLVASGLIRDLANRLRFLALLLNRLLRPPLHIIPTGHLVDIAQGLAAPPMQDRTRHVGDPLLRSAALGVLAQIDRYHLVDKERFGSSDTTWWFVPVGAVIGERFLSLSNVRFACVRANGTRPVNDVPDASADTAAVIAGFTEVEAYGLSSSWHVVVSLAEAN